jgi:hypothetical protein
MATFYISSCIGSLSCAPKNPQPKKTAWSPDILIATACAPISSGLGIIGATL